MQGLHYLTVQDVLWINLQITRATQPFEYSRLEEATYYQYGYGKSQDLLAQAAKFLQGFMAMSPFEDGNEATALVGCDAFLRINGHRLRLTEAHAPGWLLDIQTGSQDAGKALADAVEVLPDFHAGDAPNVQGAVEDSFAALGRAVEQLNAATAAN